MQAIPSIDKVATSAKRWSEIATIHRMNKAEKIATNQKPAGFKNIQ